MGHDPNALGSLLGLWIFIAIVAALIGGRAAASNVLAAPFRLCGWVLRGILSATGRGTQRILADVWRGFTRLVAHAHSYCYGRWPGATLLGYAVAIVATVLYIYLR